MTTLRKWLDHFTERTGEIPTRIVFGGNSWFLADEDAEPLTRFHIDSKYLNKVQTFAIISDETLDREFDDGYGGNESPNLCAWSKSYVIFSDNYDGAEGLQWVPRHPVDHRPIRPGGG